MVSLFPGISERGFPFLIAFLVLLILSFMNSDRGRSFSLLLLVVISLYHVLEVSTFSSGIPTEGDLTVMARVIGNPGMTEKRKTSFDVEVILLKDRLDNYGNAKGRLHAISKEHELYSGDLVVMEGKVLDDSLFLADSITVRRHSLLYKVKRAMLGFIRRRLSVLDWNERELALRLVLASGNDTSFELSEKAREKGVSHVFALSGMHLELIFSFSSYMLIFIRSDEKRRRLILIPLTVFSFLSSFGASLLRALLMRGLKAAFPKLDSQETLCYAFLLQSFISPHMLLTAGGILSYMSIAAILLLSDYSEKLGSILGNFLITSGCLLSTGFYSISTFESFTLSGLLYSPLVSVIVRFYMTLVLLFLMLPLPFVPQMLTWLYSALSWCMALPDVKIASSFKESYLVTGILFLLLFFWAYGKKKGFAVSFMHCVEPELRKHNRTQDRT